MSWIFSTFISVIWMTLVHCKVTPDMTCTPNSASIEVSRDGVKDVQLKSGGMPGCEFSRVEDFFRIHLNFTFGPPCGFQIIRQKRINAEVMYYNTLTVQTEDGRLHLLKVRCIVPPSRSRGTQSNIYKRNVLPPEFVEPDFIEITSEVTGTAPIPELSVGVRQSGKLIGDQVTVSPGAPLVMEVYLNSESASTYGILVSYMIVTDNTDKKETIVFNGCTQDQYLFENFQTNKGDFLTAKFRAFKFPESSYLFFRVTVDVCLDKCQGIQCSNGEIGYGRRRRAIPETADPNKIFEVTMMTLIKVEMEESDLGSASAFILQQNVSSNSARIPALAYEHEEAALQSVKRSEHPPPPPFIIFERSGSNPSYSPLILVGLLLVALALLSL